MIETVRIVILVLAAVCVVLLPAAVVCSRTETARDGEQ